MFDLAPDLRISMRCKLASQVRRGFIGLFDGVSLRPQFFRIAAAKTVGQRELIAKLAAKDQLPTVYP
jgi:hypothetical protein